MKPLFSKIKHKIFNKKVLIGGLVLLIAGALTVVGLCTIKRPDAYQMALDNIAEARFYLKSAGADHPLGEIQLYSGMRESDFQADGIATPSQPFTVLSIEPKDQKIVFNGCITVAITINDEAPVTLVLEKNPYGNNYAADLEKAVPANATVTVTCQAGSETIGTAELQNVMPEDAVQWETALEIACQALSDKIKTDTRWETATKILCDHTTADTPYWFVSFVTETGDRYFVVIAADGKVVGTSEK